MLTIFLSFVLVGFAACQLGMSTRLNLTFPTEELSDEDMQEWSTVETILSPLNDSELIELEKLDEMSKEKAKEMGISEAMSLEKKRRRRR
ncbi:hypothetical protein NECAME_14139 [Necator americanus]|uniref:Uncharacterized protein n=1 Tax=Necator americanus TaxID=51031 RepID=W2SSK4_NECAM|nr:hypothetical protein NECAME_14139 [Necator americanus]ETN71682.1 hypothetical protein NECAME_14139 [Necator americanus]